MPPPVTKKEADEPSYEQKVIINVESYRIRGGNYHVLSKLERSEKLEESGSKAMRIRMMHLSAVHLLTLANMRIYRD